LYDPNPSAIYPRIESLYNYNPYNPEGIVVTSIESQYYKRVRNKFDFETYRNLVVSHKIGEYMDILTLDYMDLFLTPQNTFAQISSDISIVYSFCDEMEKNNIFDITLTPSVIKNFKNNLGNFTYNEEGFIPILEGNLDDTQYSDYNKQSIITEFRYYWFAGKLREQVYWEQSYGNYQSLYYEKDPTSTMLSKENTHDDSSLYSQINLGRYNSYDSRYWVTYLVHIPEDMQAILQEGHEAKLRFNADIYYNYAWSEWNWAECSTSASTSVRLLDGPSGLKRWNNFGKDQWKPVETSIAISEANLYNGEYVRVQVYSSVDTTYFHGSAYNFVQHWQNINVNYMILERSLVPLFNNKLIEIKPTLSKTSLPSKSITLNPIEDIYNDPCFGNNTIDYLLENSIITPIFRRGNEEIFTSLELEALKFDFSVYPPDYSTESFAINDIEGTEIKYNCEDLRLIVNYNSSRFKNSAIDNLQIPLLTPLELNFGDINLEGLSDIELELTLNLDVSLRNRAIDSNWSLRFRLLYFDYNKNEWRDFDGAIRAENLGIDRAVWDPGTTSHNPIYYVQNPEENNFIPIKDKNKALQIRNPLIFKNIN